MVMTYHAHDALIPSLDDLALADAEGEGLLTRVLGAPELLAQISVLAEPSAMDSDVPPFSRSSTGAFTEDFLLESHFVKSAMVIRTRGRMEVTAHKHNSRKLVQHLNLGCLTAIAH